MSLTGFVLASACSSDEEEPDTNGSNLGQPEAGDGASSKEDAAPPPRQELQPEWLTCQEDSDCVVAQARSCSACVMLSANAEHIEEYKRITEEVENCPPRPPAPCPPVPDPICIMGKCDILVDCEKMEEAGLCGELAKCSVLSGTPCSGDASGPVKVGCFPRQVGAPPTPTCGEDPETGVKLVFSTTHIPDGWSPCDTSACDF